MAEQRNPGRHLTPSSGAELTIDRLFDAPALTGPTVLGIKVSADGQRVTYLKAKLEAADQLDLWVYEVAAAHAHRLVDSATLATSPGPLSEEERDRRERQRTAALSGIVDYALAPSGREVLFTLDGSLYYLDFASGSEGRPLPIAPTSGAVTDARLSPHGAWLAYVRAQNLIVYHLAERRERALTTDGGAAIKNGMAEYVAQEEMDRHTGYWWSPDERHIAFARVDESRVALTQRFEIAADTITTHVQRYPAAGGINATVTLGVIAVPDSAVAPEGAATPAARVTWIDLGADPDIYLARVDWLPDGKTLAIQRQSRDQRRLDLLFADITTGHTRVVLTETSDSWIDLNDELTFLKETPQFIWASARDGRTHLYLYDTAGRLLRQLTAGDWSVDAFRQRAIKAVDERHRLVYFTATAESSLERHLYSTSLDTTEPHRVRRLTQEPGVHDIVMAAAGDLYVDRFSSTVQPPQVALYRLGGAALGYLVENRLDSHHPDAPYVSDNSIAEFGTLTAADGQTLEYRVFKPAHFDPTQRHPAIVDVYGGPGVQRVLNTWAGSSFTQILTRAGYVVFQLDNRGSAFRGRRFQSPIQGKLGDVEVADQRVGAEWLAAQPFIDASRIGVWGWSYGGYMTLMLMFKAPEVFRAGVAGAPVTDWTLYDTHYTERFLGTPTDNADGYAASAVLPYAAGLQGKLLLVHGMADDNVLFANSTRLMSRLQHLGKPFDVMVYPGGKHALLRQHDGRHAYATIKRFFDTNLRPAP